MLILLTRESLKYCNQLIGTLKMYILKEPFDYIVKDSIDLVILHAQVSWK